MSCLTKLFHHTGTTSPTDIGPASGGVLHSIVIAANVVDVITVRDGGSGGTIIAKLYANGVQFRFNGIRLSGQLNVELANAGTFVSVEISELP